MTMYAEAIKRGPGDVDGEVLIGVVVTAGYEFDADHLTLADVAAFETEASAYARLSATADAAQRTDDNAAWILFLEGVDEDVDLSDDPEANGIVWAKPGANDAARLLVDYAEDPSAAGNGSWSPDWPDGIDQFPIASLGSMTVADVGFTIGPNGLNVDGTALAAALNLILGGSHDVDGASAGGGGDTIQLRGDLTTAWEADDPLVAAREPIVLYDADGNPTLKVGPRTGDPVAASLAKTLSAAPPVVVVAPSDNTETEVAPARRTLVLIEPSPEGTSRAEVILPSTGNQDGDVVELWQTPAIGEFGGWVRVGPSWAYRADLPALLDLSTWTPPSFPVVVGGGGQAFRINDSGTLVDYTVPAGTYNDAGELGAAFVGALIAEDDGPLWAPVVDLVNDTTIDNALTSSTGGAASSLQFVDLSDGDPLNALSINASMIDGEDDWHVAPGWKNHGTGELNGGTYKHAWYDGPGAPIEKQNARAIWSEALGIWLGDEGPARSEFVMYALGDAADWPELSGASTGDPYRLDILLAILAARSSGGGGSGPDLSDDDPAAHGAASEGTSPDASRSDHVHPMPSASDVGAVPTTRTIGGVDLSANRSLADLGLGPLATATSDPQAVRVVAASRTTGTTPIATALVPVTGGANTDAIALGRQIFAPVIHSGQTITALTVIVSATSLTGSQPIEVSCYAAQADGTPGAQIWTTSIAIGTTTANITASGLSLAMPNGRCWISVLNPSGNAGTVTLRSGVPWMPSGMVGLANGAWAPVIDLTSVAAAPADPSAYGLRNVSNASNVFGVESGLSRFPIIGATA